MSFTAATRTIILLCHILICNAAGAQKILFSEDFTYYAQINFSYPWSSAGGANVFHWRCDIPYQIFGNDYLYFGNNTKVAGTLSRGSSDDVLLVTPSISLSNVRDAYLSYDSYFLQTQSGGKTESATVEISTDNGVTWILLRHAPISAAMHMDKNYVNLAAYNNASSVRLGFRYSDSLKPMFGWMIDNIKVFVPSPNDIALVHVYPEDSYLSYFAIPGNVHVQGAVMNMGTDTIHSFSIYHREGTGAVHMQAVAGVNISSFDTLLFVHTVPYRLEHPWEATIAGVG